MKRSTPELFILIVAILAIAACAKISSPSGGLRDRVPPVVEKSIPENSTRNFSGKEIEIGFDEFVVLDNINDKFMVSPPMEKKPRVFTRGKSVRIEYEDELKDSTTYTFYFLDAIRDLNEGNILDNYKFVFSTGSVIDSLSVTGNVYTAMNLEIPLTTTVMLYSDLTDSAVVKQLPDYISRVDQTGYFRIDNIKGGTYRLFALTDDDNSKNYNRVEEAFAFSDSLINVTPAKNYIAPVKDTLKKTVVSKETKAATAPLQTKTIGTKVNQVPELPALKGDHRLILFLAKKKARYLANDSRDARYKLTYILSLPPDTMHFNFRIPEVATDSYFIEKTPNRDSITVWLTDSTVYSQPQITSIVEYPFTDTLGIDGYREDTITMRFLTPRAPRSGKATRPRLTLQNNIAGGSLKPGQKLVFRSETPLKEPDTTRIRLYQLDEKTKKKIPYNILRDTADSKKLILDARLPGTNQYLLITDSASFSNIFNEYNDSTGIRFSVREAASYSSLILNMTNCEGNCIVQLLDKTEKLLAESKISGNGRVTFPLLEKGSYRARVIFDLNGDEKWTTGDYFTGRQPEPVSYYPTEIEIPENWQTIQPWDVKEMNFKEQLLRQKPKTTR